MKKNIPKDHGSKGGKCRKGIRKSGGRTSVNCKKIRDVYKNVAYLTRKAPYISRRVNLYLLRAVWGRKRGGKGG